MKSRSCLAIFFLVVSTNLSMAHAATVHQVCAPILNHCGFYDQMDCTALQDESDRGSYFDSAATDVCQAMSGVCGVEKSAPATDCLEAIESKKFANPGEISTCAQLANAGKFDDAISCLKQLN